MRLDYWNPKKGWWVGHRSLPPVKGASWEDYVRGMSGTYRVRVIRDDGSVIGDSCSECGEPHEGLDGSCLLA